MCRAPLPAGLQVHLQQQPPQAEQQRPPQQLQAGVLVGDPGLYPSSGAAGPPSAQPQGSAAPDPTGVPCHAAAGQPMGAGSNTGSVNTGDASQSL
jgi:hypothetical protein